MNPTTSNRPVRLRHPVLAPGLRIAARTSGEIEIGTTPEHRLRVPDTPAVRRVLNALAGGEAPPDSPATRRALVVLAPVLREADTLLDPAAPPAEVAAVVLRHGRGAAERLRRRARHRVLLTGDADLIEALDPAGLLGRSGVRTATPPTRERYDVALVLAHGEPDRSGLDVLLRGGVPHLLVRLVESEVVVGPFVVPGRTACVRCLDAHDAAADPGRIRIATDDGPEHAPDSGRHDGVPDPVDAALTATALGWAVADLVRFAEGDRPTTWSATVSFTAGRPAVEAVARMRHPDCACWWGAAEGDAPSVTMGA